MEAPEIYLLDEDTVRQEKPPAVAAAQAALARVMGEETEADARNAKHHRRRRPPRCRRHRRG